MSVKPSLTTLMKRILMVGVLCLMVLAVLVANVTASADMLAGQYGSHETNLAASTSGDQLPASHQSGASASDAANYRFSDGNAGLEDASNTQPATTCEVFSGQSAQTTGDLDVTHQYDGRQFSYIYIYGYSSDNDTLSATISGYNPTTGTWQTIVSSGGGTRVILNQAFEPALYTQVRVQLNDTDNNDTIYYDYQFTDCPVADLSITKTDSSDPAMAGTPLTYSITATNLGVTDTTGVVLTDTLPTEVTFDSATSSQGSCTGGSTVVCDLGNLASGASATATIVVIPTALGTITNMASVSSDLFDFDPSNNSASETTMVEGLALNSVAITGPSAGTINTGYTFTANIDPTNATQPVTYLWQATGQSDVTHTGGASDTVTFNWNTGGEKSITVTASNIVGSVSSTHLISINSPPTANDATFSVEENRPASTIVGTVSATDQDAGDSLTYAITAGAEGKFGIDANTGQISLSSPLNFEDSSVYNLTVQVEDSGGLTDSASITINVQDVNEAPSANNATFSVEENRPASTIVGTVSATDQDAGDSLTYAITAGAEGKFGIDANTGQISLRSPLNFEDRSVYNLTVQVEDSGGLTDSASITINVQDVNEAPTVNDATFDVAENRPAGTIVGTVSATDQDAGDSLTYAITAGAEGKFAIDANTGQISLSSPLNFEESRVYTLTVRVQDSGGLSDSASITINVQDVNEAPTVNDGSFSVEENSPAGTIVGTVSATDEDGDSLTYAITAGDEGKFAIGASTGQISLSSPLNFEQSPVYNLTVQVRDTGGLTGNATITVNVGNVSEPPISVAIDGPEIGGIGQSYTFTATVGSSIAKAPITYLWQATGQDDVTHTYNVGGLQDTVTFSWQMIGTKTIMVTVSNASGSASDSQTITIENLPPVANNVRITPSEPDPKGSSLRFVPTPGTEIHVEYDYSDADGDPQGDTLIRWSRGDQIEQQEQSILNEQETVPGTLTTISEELWCVTVTPHDGSLYGQPNQACVYIENIPNQVPIVEEANVTENPSSDDPLEVSFSVSDTDDSGLFPPGRASGSASVDVRWYRNDVLQPAFNDNGLVSENETNVGEKWCARLRAFDGKNFGPQKESVCQIISPPGHTLPIVKNLKITPEKPKDSDPLQVSYIFVGSGDSLRLGEGDTQIRWFRNGLIQRDLNDQRVISATLTAPGERWHATVRPHDGFGYGSLDLSRPVYIGKDQNQQNTPPKVINVQIKPAEPREGDVLELSYEFIDPDGDPEGDTTIHWYKNLSRMPALTSSVVEAKHTQAKDVWYAVVIPHDGQEYGLDVAAHSVTISSVPANNPPRALNVFLTPAIPGDEQDLQLYYLYDDKDGDLEAKSQIRWTRNFEPQPDYDDRSAIPGQVTQVDDTWCAMVRPYDGQDYGSTVQANRCVKIQNVGDNTPPEVTNAYILPASATSDDDLELHYEYSDADNDRERDTIINWYRNGTLQNQFNNETVIRASETSPDDVWSAYILPHDGTDIGGKVRTPPIIINSPPEVVAWITPTVALESHHLMLSYEFTDSDRDPESEVQIHWYKNGVHQSDYDGQKEVPSEATVAGESWYVKIRVSDGFQLSESVTTEAVTIAPMPLLYLPMIIRPKPGADIPTPVPPTPVPPTPVPPTPVPPTPLPLDPFEENDTQETAYGALVHAQEYDALPNDKDDWYYFELTETSSDVYLEVSNYHGDGQLALYREDLSNRGLPRVHIANDGRGERTMQIPNNMNRNALKDLRPGKYLVRIYTVDDYREDASYRYSLRVDYDLR